MIKTDPVRVGVILGLALVLFHAGWAVLVAVGWAQEVMDFVFWVHFIAPVYHVEPFVISQAFALFTFVFLAGLIFGTAGGWLWNRIVAR